MWTHLPVQPGPLARAFRDSHCKRAIGSSIRMAGHKKTRPANRPGLESLAAGPFASPSRNAHASRDLPEG